MGGAQIASQEHGEATVSDAIGALAECVMALYGLHRLTRSREVGSAKLRLALEAFRRSFDGHCSRVEEALAGLSSDTLQTGRRSSAPGRKPQVAVVGSDGGSASPGEERPSREEAADLSPALEILSDTFAVVCEDMLDALAVPAKIGAARRLMLERQLEAYGMVLESLHAHVEVFQAASRPRRIVLSPADLAEWRWTSLPSFEPRSLPVVLRYGAATDLYADPVVLWRLLQIVGREVASATGATALELVVRPAPAEGDDRFDASRGREGPTLCLIPAGKAGASSPAGGHSVDGRSGAGRSGAGRSGVGRSGDEHWADSSPPSSTVIFFELSFATGGTADVPFAEIVARRLGIDLRVADGILRLPRVPA